MNYFISTPFYFGLDREIERGIKWFVQGLKVRNSRRWPGYIKELTQG